MATVSPKFDVIIIGAGIIGMMTARELVQAGQSVLILEKGEVGRESSWAGGGILSPLYPWRYPAAVSVLARWGHDHYPAICQELKQQSGIDPEWIRSGLLVLGDEELEQARAWAECYQMQLQHWDLAQVQGHEPRLQTTKNALWLPEVGQVRNPRMVRALEQYLRRQGVEFRCGVEVLGFDVVDGQLQGINTSSGLLPARRVVSCAGAWSGELFETVKVEPVKGQMLVFAAEPGLVTKIVLDQGRYLIPRRDGHVVVGSTLEHTGFDKATSEEARQSLLETALALYPDLEQYPVERHWAGLRPGSPQGIPTIGEHPQIDGLLINTGHYRNGVIIGAASARLAADLVLGREPVVAAEPYTLG
jgi:glycine oxidase